MNRPLGVRLRHLGAALAVSAWMSACAAPEGAGWGAEGSLTPGWDRIGEAVVEAATDPFTWAPAVGAAALQIGDLDEDVADWARDEHPVFGSSEAADDASDWLRIASFGVYGGIALAAPVAEGESWGRAKARSLGVGVGTVLGTRAIVEGLKVTTGRERPLDQDDRSFPSGHAATTAAAARLSAEALEDYRQDRGWRMAGEAGLGGLALLTGWARVEAGEHYPADVLAGAALGNFVAVLATEAFMREDEEPPLALSVQPWRDGMAASATLRF